MIVKKRLKMMFCLGGFYNLVRAGNSLKGRKGENGMQTAATTKMTNLETIKGAIAEKMDAANFSSWIAPLNF